VGGGVLTLTCESTGETIEVEYSVVSIGNIDLTISGVDGLEDTLNVTMGDLNFAILAVTRQLGKE